MAIDFHTPDNRRTYAGREATSEWRHTITQIVDPAGLRVADIGCGGGIYSAAWADLGADTVTAVDFSIQMLRDASETNFGRSNVTIRQGDASCTGLPDGSHDVIFQRALIHHVPDRLACFREGWRVLGPGGLCIVQDRTLEDVALRGSPEHLRGYFFEAFPRLLSVEQERRPDASTLRRQMVEAGFDNIQQMSFWEVRRQHADAAALAQDLKARTGRSILHELSDEELEALAKHILARLPAQAPVTEQDRWTIWWGRK